MIHNFQGHGVRYQFFIPYRDVTAEEPRHILVRHTIVIDVRQTVHSINDCSKTRSFLGCAQRCWSPRSSDSIHDDSHSEYKIVHSPTMILPKYTTLSFITLISVIAAAPLPAPPKNRPPVPSVEDFQKNHLNVQPDKTLFYSGVSGKLPPAHAKANNLQTLNDSWKDKKFQDQFQNHEGDSRKFFNPEALAKSASGKAQVMLPKSAPNAGKHDSTWAKHEFPHLKRPGVELHRLNVGASGKVEGSRQLTDKTTGKAPIPPKPANLQAKAKPPVPPKPANLQAKAKPPVPPKPANLQAKSPAPASPKAASPQAAKPAVPPKPANLQAKGKKK